MSPSPGYAITGCVLAALSIPVGISLANPAGNPKTHPATAASLSIEQDIRQCMADTGFRYQVHIPVHAAIDDAVQGVSNEDNQARIAEDIRAAHPKNPNRVLRASHGDDAAQWDNTYLDCRTHAVGVQLDRATDILVAQNAKLYRKGATDISAADAGQASAANNTEQRIAQIMADGAGHPDPVLRYVRSSAAYAEAILAYEHCISGKGFPAANPTQFLQRYGHGNGSHVPKGSSSTRQRFLDRANVADLQCRAGVDQARDDAIDQLSTR